MAVKAKEEREAFSRQKLISSLLQIKHGDLTLYTEQVLKVAEADSELLAHLIAWNVKNGKVRDAKVALPVLALRGLKPEDKDLAENAVAHLLTLSPRELIRAYQFSRDLTKGGNVITGGHRRMLEAGLKQYLAHRETNFRWWDRSVLQHRGSMKALYRAAHKKPSPRAQSILFDGKYPEKSVFAKVAALHTLTPAAAAAVILNEKLPFEVAIGAVAKAKDRDVVFALLEGMTGNQVITNTKMLEKFGVMKDPALKAAYEKAVERAKTDDRVETLKAGKAASQVKGSAAEGKLEGIQAARTKKLGSIEGDWLILGDASGSMSKSIDLARQIAALITERVSGQVYLVMFNTSPRFFEVTGKTYTQILEETRRISAGGGTSIGCGLDLMRTKGVTLQGIVIASDGGDNTKPLFHEAYQKYVQKMEIEPTVYFFRVPGDKDDLSKLMKNAGLEIDVRDMEDADYYSLPSIIPTLRASRYALFEEIMETPLLTFAQVFAG